MEKIDLRKATILGGIAAAAVILLTLFIIVIVQIFALAPLKRERAQARDRLAAIQQEQQGARDFNAYLRSGQFLEDYAREVLEQGRPGGVKYRPR